MTEKSENSLAEEIEEFTDRLSYGGIGNLEDLESDGLYETEAYGPMTSDSMDSMRSSDRSGPVDKSQVREDALGVGQAEFAYLDPELMDRLDYNALETGGIGPCYGVALRSEDGEALALIHADKDKMSQIREGVNSASREMGVDFDAAKLVTNAKDDEEYERVVGYLQQQFEEVDADAGDGFGSRAVGVDEEGFYEPENPAIPEPENSELEGMATIARQGLKDRTEEAIEESLQQGWEEYETNHLPEELSKKWVTDEDGNPRYSHRWHNASSNSNKATYGVRLRIGDADVEELDIDFDVRVRERGEERRINIKSRHPLKDDREKVEELNKEAARVYNKVSE